MRNIRSLAGGDATMNATSHLDPRLRKQLLAVAARPDSNLGEAIQTPRCNRRRHPPLPNGGVQPMNYGLWMSAAGMGSQVHRQSVIANNLANASTAAFKPDFTITRERPAAIEERGLSMSGHHLLERLGGGVLVEPTWTDFAQGAFEESGNPLDLALDGPGFFLLNDGDGKERLSRSGVFERSPKGMLVSSDGYDVLDHNHRPIRLPSGGKQRGFDRSGRRHAQ